MMLGIDPDHSMGSRSCKGKKMKKDFGTKVPMGVLSGGYYAFVNPDE